MECGFGSLLTERECHLEAEENGLCVFHRPKPSLTEGMTQAQITEWTDITRRCETEFISLLERLQNDPSVTECDFRGFRLYSLELPRVVSKSVNFHGAEFQLISLENVEFLGNADFGCKVADIADFSNCTFCGEADFSGAHFKHSAIFSDAKFKSKAKFWMTEFQSAWFKNSTFESVDFFMTEVKGSAVFDHTKFSNLAHFTHSKFIGDADFSEAVFEAPTNFGSTVFSGPASFQKTEFHSFADFSAVAFLGRARFQRSLFNEAYGATFNRLDLGRDSDLVFESVNLSRACFLDTNLEQIGFRDVTWHRPVSSSKVWRRSRASLWDELRPLAEQARDFERIAENYRQLVLIYERKRDFETAEDFHTGEMEMRRKKMGVGLRAPWLRTLREWGNAYGVYRLSSGYGTSYIQALGLLLAFVVLFSFGFLYSGFRDVREANSSGRVIEYNLLADSAHHTVPLRQWSSDYLAAVSLCASIITFQKDRFYEPLPGIARFWLYIALVVFTGQSALVLLAIRRRFKR